MGPQASSWEEADVGSEVKPGILTAEWGPSFGSHAPHQEGRSATGQHVCRAAEEKKHAAECARAFMYAL